MSQYHDYVIKNGKFIGKFEEMYQVIDDPWHQSQTTLSKARRLTIQNLNDYQVSNVVEFGCGLGHFTQAIHADLPNLFVKGVDVSHTAIEKAKKLYPHLDFEANAVSSIQNYAQCDAFLFAEITWYILPELRNIFDSMLEHAPGKLFFHNLSFYFSEDQKYGREFFSSIEEFIEFCPFEVLEKNVFMNWRNRSIETHSVFKIVQK